MYKIFDQFFNLSPDVKAKYAKKKITSQNVSSQNGWDAIEVERFVIHYYHYLILSSDFCVTGDFRCN